MEHPYTFHHHTRSMSSLASTIVPIHSDVSTSTSVTASPMELLEDLDPPVELKATLPDVDPPEVLNLDVTDRDAQETPIPEARTEDLQTGILPANCIDSPQQSREELQRGDRTGSHGKPEVEQRPDQANLEKLGPSPTMKLAELKELVHQEQYHKSQAASLRNKLDNLALVDGLNRRLIPSLSMAFQGMADAYQNGDQAAFAELYQACEELRNTSNTHAPRENPGPNLPQLLVDQDPQGPESWLDKLPLDLQEILLNFITKLRTDPNFLADRLSALSFGAFAEVLSQSSISQYLNPTVGTHHQRQISGLSWNPSLQGSFPLLEKLRQFHQGDVLFTLFHVIFDSLCGPTTKEYFRRTQTWSTACAKVIVEGKPGSDALVLTTLNAFSDTSGWHLFPQIESYIADLLQQGVFLVDPASRSSQKSMEPLEIRNANAAIASSKFYDKALKDLLSILLNASPDHMMPDGLLHFVRSTLLKIPNNEVRARARKFITSKWFFSSFLGRILTYPESCNMLTKHYIGPNSRGTILKEVANRLQKQVFDVQHSCRKGLVQPLDPEMHSLVEQVLKRFSETRLESGQDLPASSTDTDPDVQTLMLSISDVTCLLKTLFPTCGRSKTSANPSTAGSSTLVSESLQDGIFKSNSPSVSDLLGTGNKTTKVDPFYPLDNSSQNDAEANPMGAPSVTGRTDLSEALEHRLVRVYNYLSSLSHPESATSSEIPALGWALVTIGSEGRVPLPHTEDSSAHTHHVGRSEQEYPSGEAVTDDLRSGIIHLLAQGTIRLDPSPSLPRLEDDHAKNIKSLLIDLMNTAVDQATSEYDYQGMHYWWQMQILLRDSDTPADSLLRSISSVCQESIRIYRNISRSLENKLYSISLAQKGQIGKLRSEQEHRKALRMKMWYASDVRHSSTFEDAFHVTQALRAMVNSPRSKQASGVANWARQRLKNVSWQERSVAQTVEALTEPNEYSGTCKLNDDQVERTSRWLTRHSIENFCRGEERIQRFCFEIQKCVNKLSGPTLLESPVLWSSRLFEQEKRNLDRKIPGSRSQHLNSSMSNPPRSSATFPQSHWRHMSQGDQSAILSTAHNSPIFHSSSPREPVRSFPLSTSQPFAMLPDSAWASNPSFVGYGRSSQTSKVDAAKRTFSAEVKRDLYSLMLSDLGYLPWHSGTETDTWVKHSSLDANLALPGLHTDGRKPAEKTNMEPQAKESLDSQSYRTNLLFLLNAAPSLVQDSSSKWQTIPGRDIIRADDVKLGTHQDLAPSFPYRQSYEGILRRFSMSPDPQYKLRMLHELELLVSRSIQESISASSNDQVHHGTDFPTSLSRSQTVLVPRTKATSFEEVIANCTERRAGTMKLYKPIKPSPPGPADETFSTDEIVNSFLTIFRDIDLRPLTLFRDLQYIAAFVPPEILDQTAQGKAFWDAGLAALALKQEICDAMVARATDITNYHVSASSSSPNPPPLTTTNNNNNNNISQTTLQDAAHLWIIAAKEGSATAARELGLLYLTHPTLLPRTTLQPFSKPKEVFRTLGAKKEGSGTVAEEGRLDPVTFAVVFHWMEVAASGGDRDARDFLRGNGEWGGR